MRAGITGAFGIPGENENGRGVVEFCDERRVCVGNFKHKNLHKYTRMAWSQDGVEGKSMIDLVLVKEDMLRFVQGVRAVRGMGRDISDHHVVLCKVRLMRTWIKRGEVVDRARMIRSEKLREHHYREEYARSLERKSRMGWGKQCRAHVGAGGTGNG